MWQSLEIFKIFKTLTWKQIFWKMETLFKKLENSFLAESTKTESATFLWKTALSVANVKTNRMEITKWIYHKEQSSACNYFIFSNILFQLKKKLVQRADLMYQPPKCSYSCLSWSNIASCKSILHPMSSFSGSWTHIIFCESIMHHVK